MNSSGSLLDDWGECLAALAFAVTVIAGIMQIYCICTQDLTQEQLNELTRMNTATATQVVQ
jgi:hypothetical protein